ncbi:MAG: biosynthetic peptidoglycan transglycosylase, partial [Anaerolineaceae bacterium]
MNDIDRSEQDIPTQPGDRLRKILAASTEEDALQNETSQGKGRADLESAPVDDGMQQTNGEDLAEQNTPVEKEDAGTNLLVPSEQTREAEMQGTSGQDEKNPELEDTAPIFKADLQPAEHNAVDGMTETTQDSDEQFQQQGNLSAPMPFPGTSQFIGDDQTIAQSNQASTFDEKTKPSLTDKDQRKPSSYPPPPPLGDGFVPGQVNEIDLQATRVTPRAYSNTNRTTRTEPPIQNLDKHSPAETSKKPVRSKAKPLKNKTGNSSKKGCFSQFIIAGLFVFVLAVVGVITYGVYQYFTIASSLPSIEDLSSQASQFETTRILDRSNNVIYEIIDPNAGRRTYIPLEKMSPYIIAATIATEDKEFYNHPGFDPVALVRALWTNYTSGEIVSGASTITQQLARGLLFDQQERYEQTIHRKAREIVLATEINRKYTKEEILELYLNENYYSNFAYGIEAAAETYFNTTADQLTLGQAAFLAGLPQAPSVYDIFSNRDVTINRQKQVLILMLQLSQERGCIYVSENQDRVCVDEIASAAKE